MFIDRWMDKEDVIQIHSEMLSSISKDGIISFAATVLPMNIQDWFPLGLTGLISLKSLLQHHNSKAPILWHSAFLMVQISHWYMTPGKSISLDYTDLCQQVMSFFFNMLSRFVITFLPRSKHLLNFMAAITVSSDLSLLVYRNARDFCVLIL